MPQGIGYDGFRPFGEPDQSQLSRPNPSAGASYDSIGDFITALKLQFLQGVPPTPENINRAQQRAELVASQQAPSAAPINPDQLGVPPSEAGGQAGASGGMTNPRPALAPNTAPQASPSPASQGVPSGVTEPTDAGGFDPTLLLLLLGGAGAAGAAYLSRRGAQPGAEAGVPAMRPGPFIENMQGPRIEQIDGDPTPRITDQRGAQITDQRSAQLTDQRAPREIAGPERPLALPAPPPGATAEDLDRAIPKTADGAVDMNAINRASMEATGKPFDMLNPTERTAVFTYLLENGPPPVAREAPAQPPLAQSIPQEQPQARAARSQLDEALASPATEEEVAVPSRRATEGQPGLPEARMQGSDVITMQDVLRVLPATAQGPDTQLLQRILWENFGTTAFTSLNEAQRRQALALITQAVTESARGTTARTVGKALR